LRTDVRLFTNDTRDKLGVDEGNEKRRNNQRARLVVESFY